MLDRTDHSSFLSHAPSVDPRALFDSQMAITRQQDVGSYLPITLPVANVKPTPYGFISREMRVELTPSAGLSAGAAVTCSPPCLVSFPSAMSSFNCDLIPISFLRHSLRRPSFSDEIYLLRRDYPSNHAISSSLNTICRFSRLLYASRLK